MPDKDNNTPWAQLIQPQCSVSCHPSSNQCRGRVKAMLRITGSVPATEVALLGKNDLAMAFKCRAWSRPVIDPDGSTTITLSF